MKQEYNNKRKISKIKSLALVAGMGLTYFVGYNNGKTKSNDEFVKVKDVYVQSNNSLIKSNKILNQSNKDQLNTIEGLLNLNKSLQTFYEVHVDKSGTYTKLMKKYE